MNDNRFFSGNSMIQSIPGGNGHDCSAIPRPLVEEAIQITLADLRQLCGRKELLKAAEDARAVNFQILGNDFSIHLLAEPHRVPNRRWGVSDREVTRLWLVCAGCRRKKRKLFTYPKFPGSSILLMAFCRQCHTLTYQSQNCGGNKWWREIALPLKRLFKRRERLLARKQSAKTQAELDFLDQSIFLLRHHAGAKNRTPKRTAGTGPVSRLKRTYRDLSLIGL